MAKKTKEKSCFVIMPISDPEGYEYGHFANVYNHLIKPACAEAGYEPIRADEVKQTNLIHVDILQKLIESKMVVCDLSASNPNVLFELGLRQAFDKPVVLIQESENKRIFDISLLRSTEYNKELKIHKVEKDRFKITQAIIETAKAAKDSNNSNSLIKLLSLTAPASIPQYNQNETYEKSFSLILSEINALRADFSKPEIKNLFSGRPMTSQLSKSAEKYKKDFGVFSKMLSNSSSATEIDYLDELFFKLQSSFVILKENSILSATQVSDFKILADRYDDKRYQLTQP